MYILGVDLGTTSMTCLVYKDGKDFVTKQSAAYPLYTAKGGVSEQDPKYWLDSFDEIISNISEEVKDFQEKLSAIAVSGQMHSLVTIDKEGKVVRPAILWNDTRTSNQVKILNENFKLLNMETQNKAIEGFTLPKLLWMQENEEDLLKTVDKVMMPKDYLNYYLTNEILTDESDAAGTIIYNVQKRKWSKELIDYYKLDPNLFPKVVKPGSFIADLTSKNKKKYGFVNNVKVFMGAADNVASALGVGIYNEKKAMLSLGTSGVYLSLEPKFRENDGEVHFFNYADNYHYSMGVTLAAGKSLNWYKDLIAPDLNYDQLMSEISDSCIGANRLLFTPYIQGERTPHTSSTIRGSFIGLDVTHSRSDLTRAVIEGISFSLKECQDKIEASRPNVSIDEIVVVGGGAKSEQWLSLIANIMGKKVTSVNIEEGAALGSIILAAKELGVYKNYKEAYENLNSSKEEYNFSKEENTKYNEVYNLYKEVYESTKKLTKKLQQLD